MLAHALRWLYALKITKLVFRRSLLPLGGSYNLPMEFLIVCPLTFLAGFIDAVAGGGGLVSLPAFLFAGVPVHMALGTNKLSSSMGTTIATIKYACEGYMVASLVAAGIPLALLGSALGSSAVLLVGDWIIQWIMLVILPFAAFFVLKTKDLDRFAAKEISRRRAALITAAIALVVGFYDGFYGPGTGTFLMLLLTVLGHQTVRTAAGTTKAINLSTNLAALVVFLVNGTVLLPLGLASGAFNICGNYLGARGFVRQGSALARPLMLVVIVLFAIRLIVGLALGTQ